MGYLAGFTKGKKTKEPSMQEIESDNFKIVEEENGNKSDPTEKDIKDENETNPKEKETETEVSRNKLLESMGNRGANSADLLGVFSKAFWSPRILHTEIFTPSQEIDVKLIWDSFFDRAYEISNQCLQLNVLTMDDFVSEEPFLYLGLPSLTLIEAAHRSIDTPGRIVLSTGMQLTQDNCPPKYKLLYLCMETSRDRLKTLELNDCEIAVMKLRLLFAGDESKEVPIELMGSIETTRLSAINAVVAEVTSVAIHLTQEAIFKKHFREVFEEIGKKQTNV